MKKKKLTKEKSSEIQLLLKKLTKQVNPEYIANLSKEGGSAAQA